MEMGPAMFTQDAVERIEQLTDGFERLGDTDTPYTLRSGEEKRNQAMDIHEQRADAHLDEQSNEPVTRDLTEWETNIWEYDFPGVDTIPHEILSKRTERIVTVASGYGYVTKITHGVGFDDNRIRGRFWHGVKEIEIRADESDFLGYRKGPTLAHELGHAFYYGMTPDVEYHESPPPIFETNEQRTEAYALSTRLHGQIIGPETQGISNYRDNDEELVAEVFACRVIEPQAAQRVSPAAVNRVEELFETHLGETPFE